MEVKHGIQQSLTAYLAGLTSDQTDSLRTDLVKTITTAILESETYTDFLQSDLPRILDLEQSAPDFFLDAGPDLWESCVVLDALSPCESVRKLVRLVVSKSNPRELLMTWKAATSALLSFDSPSSGFVAKIFEVEDKPLQLLDTVKASASFCLAGLVTALDAKDLLAVLTTDLDPYLQLLCKEMNEAYKYLRTDEFNGLIRALQSRSALLKDTQMFLPVLKMITVLLGLLADSDALDRNQSECVSLVLSLGRDLHVLLLTWREWFVTIFKPNESSDLHNYSAKGIALLASLSIKKTEHRDLHLPCVFSALYRLKVYVPIANLVFYTHPDVAVALLDHALSNFTGKFPSIKTPFLLVPERRQSTVQFLKETLDLIGRTADDDLRKRVTSLFQRFVSFFLDAVMVMQHRYTLLRKLVLDYQHDTAVGLILDMFLEESKRVEAFKDHKRIMEMVKFGLGKQPVGEFPNTVQSAAMLYYFHLLSSRGGESPFASVSAVRKVRTKFLEPAEQGLAKAYDADRERTKLEIVLSSVSRVIEVSKEIETR